MEVEICLGVNKRLLILQLPCKLSVLRDRFIWRLHGYMCKAVHIILISLAWQVDSISLLHCISTSLTQLSLHVFSVQDNVLWSWYFCFYVRVVRWVASHNSVARTCNCLKRDTETKKDVSYVRINYVCHSFRTKKLQFEIKFCKLYSIAHFKRSLLPFLLLAYVKV